MQIKWVGLLNTNDRQKIQIYKKIIILKLKKEQNESINENLFYGILARRNGKIETSPERSGLPQGIKELFLQWFLATVKEVHSLAWYSFTDSMDS